MEGADGRWSASDGGGVRARLRVEPEQRELQLSPQPTVKHHLPAPEHVQPDENEKLERFTC